MGKTKFAHLHCHTVHSEKDAIPEAKNYVDAIYQYNTDPNSRYDCIGFAQTDHGNISGLVKQYNACLKPDDKNRITKPIYGCEVYHCVDRTTEDWTKPERYHLVLLSTNQEGLTNLYQIVSDGGIHPWAGKSKNFPICDLTNMKGHGKGIIALTACLGGIVPRHITSGDEDGAKKYIEELKDIFDEVYLEVQPNNIPDQLIVNEALVRLSTETNTPLVMTSDSHYIYDTDRTYHDILKDMAHHKHFDDTAKLYWPEEMEEYCLAHNIPLSCISNTGIIAEKCNVDPKPKDHRGLLPIFDCPPGYDDNTYLRKKCLEGFKTKYEKGLILPNEAVATLNALFYELDVITGQGFSSYFLILWDWFDWCRSKKILTGPGRGSAAGSLISYLLNITKLNPIRNGFVFQRFMSPYRVEFPDIDTDIPTSKRQEAISYLETKYGISRISQIITFGKYKLKNITKSILSFEGVSFTEANEITKGIPDLVDGNKEVTYELIEQVATDPENPKFVSFSKQEKDSLIGAYSRLQECFKQYPKVYDGIVHLAGCINGPGVHAGGVVVCRHNIAEHGALIINKGNAYLPVLQFEMSDLDFFGFLKIDALGLSTLDVISKAMEITGLDYDWYDSEDFSRKEIYDMLKAGYTTDIFQFATPMPTRMIREFDCQTLLDLSAVNAGNRPGPLEKDKITGKSMVDLYIERRKSGIVPSINPRIDPILQKTLGVIFFQEQCIFIAQEMAGYNLGNADLRVRKTLCKKMRKKIPEIRNEFIYGKKSLYDEDHNVIGMSNENSEYCEGAIARGFTEQEAITMFDSIEAFAKYAFNQSHSGCYSELGYKEAEISYDYPAAFAVANCTVNDDAEKIQATLSLARKRKIPILGPDINNSEDEFSVEVVNGQDSIRYGLKGIKGVGVAVIQFLNEFKKRTGITFTSFDHFYDEVHNSAEAKQLVAEIQLKSGKKSPNPIKKDVEEAMIKSGCFDFCEPNRFVLLNQYMTAIKKDANYVPLDPKAFNRSTKLALEKEFLGDYISEHPLDPFPYADFDACSDNEFVEIAGIVCAAQMKSTKKSTNYMCISFKAKDGIERKVNLFNEEKSLDLKKDIRKNQIIVVKGRISKQYANITATSVKILSSGKQLSNIEAMTVDDLTKPVEPPKPTSDEQTPTIPGMADFFGFSAL